MSLFIWGPFFPATLGSHVVRQHSAHLSALHLPLSVSLLNKEFILMKVQFHSFTGRSLNYFSILGVIGRGRRKVSVLGCKSKLTNTIKAHHFSPHNILIYVKKNERILTYKAIGAFISS